MPALNPVLDQASPHATPDIARLLTLFARQVQLHGHQAPGVAQLDAFVAAPGPAVLFFTDDPRRAPECWDVAVVLPDLLAAHAPGVRVALLDPATSKAVAPRFGASIWPSLVFLRDSDYLGVIERMRDWPEYAALIPRILSRAPGAVPDPRFPPPAEAAYSPDTTRPSA
jgi:hydrogenase-1 operon protein HyaE